MDSIPRKTNFFFEKLHLMLILFGIIVNYAFVQCDNWER